MTNTNIENKIQKIINEIVAANKNESLLFRDRLKTWNMRAQNYNDDLLSVLKKAMLRVFGEESPKYNIGKEKRLFALPEQKKTHYSDDTREGLAIELALIGNNNSAMNNCSAKTRESFASEIIQELFMDMTWKRLATLDPVLPFIAEASPDAFLDGMITLVNNQIVLKQLINDEGDIFQGGFHWSGIVHALETLAWEPEFITTVISIAANQTLLDKENDIHPRPKDIFFGLFWPWNPQTLVNDLRLTMLAKSLFLYNKGIAWDILSDSIDRRIGSRHRVPQIRKNALFDFSVERTADINRGHRLIRAYKRILLDIASSDISMVPKMVQAFHLFSDSKSLERALSILSSPNVLKKNDKFKEPLWTSLRKFCIKNRVYSDMEWSFSDNKLKYIDDVISLLKPKSIISQVKYLFDNNTSDWYESNNYSEEESKIVTKQKESINNIYNQMGIDGILELSQQVNNPFLVGRIAGYIDIKLDCTKIASLLCNQGKNFKAFICGYLSECYDKGKEKWLFSFKDVNWDTTQKISFMTCMPLSSSVCKFGEKWLGENELLFWKAYQPLYISTEEKDRKFIIKKTLSFNRPDIAVKLFSWIHFQKEIIDFDSCAKALIDLAQTNYTKTIKYWDIRQLITGLQKQKRNSEQNKALIEVELLYLPLLDSNINNGISPVALDSALAESPEFFHRVITYAYKSNKTKSQDLDNIGLGKNAYILLSQWKKMPGITNNRLNFNAFNKWYSKAIELCKESGHLAVAQSHIGSVLINTPPDASGLWIDRRIAKLLDQKDNEDLRNGYYVATFNSRGAHFVDFTGEEDIKLSNIFLDKADKLEKEDFINFAKTLRLLANNYENEAKKAIRDGERFKQDTDNL